MRALAPALPPPAISVTGSGSYSGCQCNTKLAWEARGYRSPGNGLCIRRRRLPPRRGPPRWQTTRRLRSVERCGAGASGHGQARNPQALAPCHPPGRGDVGIMTIEDPATSPLLLYVLRNEMDDAHAETT